ncbi:MAG: energy-coupling factor transporter ATPase [Clostridia bacterium]|nr:energy-coupling factor transporter ATPase [Clostridia bacterium]MBR6754972.1 energy-coupling factor transporter ATPase [Clostridia bacterium]
MTALELKNISVIYGENTPFRKAALNNINVSFEKGSITGIIGHTGSGKSTLASLTNGLLKPTEGEILLYGENIWDKPKEMVKVRSRVGLVFQYPEYQLFDETVESDIAFGPKNIGLSEEEIKERVRLASEFCGLTQKELRRSPFELSGGQKRRAAIAGVIAMMPEVLVLDEPAAGLDPKGKEEILSGLVEYKNAYGATLLIISHSMEDIARYADNILVMKQGEVYMQGNVEEIFMQAEKLFDANLDVPQITKLFIELKKRNLCRSNDVYTVGYAKKEIEKLIKDSENA